MATIPAETLRKKTDAELHQFLADTRVRMHQLAFQAASRQLKDVRELRKVKREIARVMTILRERRTNS